MAVAAPTAAKVLEVRRLVKEYPGVRALQGVDFEVREGELRRAASLLGVGIIPVRVSLTDDSDLRLVDLVAPYDSARWYLANACAVCGDEARTALIAARDANSLIERSRLIAAADAAWPRHTVCTSGLMKRMVS